MAKKTKNLTVEIITHDDATRKNIPTAEFQSVLAKEQQSPIRIAYERRNRDLDPQLVWRGKDEQDWSDLIVHSPPLYIQEKVHPKVLIEDLLRRSATERKAAEPQFDLFADFNGLPNEIAKTEFYQHDANWSNRMAKKILEDYGSEEYYPYAKSICSDFRILVERIVELVLLGDVIQRHRRAVNTKGKIEQLCKIQEKDCKIIDDFMTEYSCYEHSQPVESPMEVPKPECIKEDIESLLAWLEDYRSRPTGSSP